MKKFSILGLLAIGIIAMASIFISCNNKSNCKWEISSTEQIKLNLMDKPISYTVDIRTYETEINSVEYASQKTNEKVFQYFKNYCISKGLVFDDKTMAFDVYYDLHISQSLNITDEHIKGISAYILEGEKIMHHLYVRDEQSNFFEVENVNVAVPSVTINHTFFYLEKYVFTDVKNVSAILLWGDLAAKTYKVKKYKKTPMQFEVSVRYKMPDTNFKDGGGGTESGCHYCGGDDGYCAPDPGGGLPYCNNFDYPVPTCSATELSQYEQFKSAYESWLMYDFRDNFLFNSEKGRKYIDNYYYLGEEWAGNLNFELAIQTAAVLKNFNPVMSAFLEPNTHLNEIILTPELSTSLLNLLNSYEAITKSSEGKQILNSIRGDIAQFSNLTLGEILFILNK
ncbi:MAG: hypothetical protein LBN95_03805 [Prevotellaceae bacterium]|jgi:hypothetical protein|nr:hypothetical protein [Prevotellaceae bacterium]